MGLVLVIWRKLQAGIEVSGLTLSATVFALLAITAGTLYQKRYLRATDVRTANAIQLGAALIVTLPLTFLETEAIVWNVHFIGAMAWAVLGLTLDKDVAGLVVEALEVSLKVLLRCALHRSSPAILLSLPSQSLRPR
jgi:drug/metabolite transporter (DMT)-like permease